MKAEPQVASSDLQNTQIRVSAKKTESKRSLSKNLGQKRVQIVKQEWDRESAKKELQQECSQDDKRSADKSRSRPSKEENLQKR